VGIIDLSAAATPGGVGGAGLQTAKLEPEGLSLDLHEGICAARLSDPAAGGCLRWPDRLWLLSSRGELVRGRCQSTNLCSYCAKLAAVENAALLAHDAMIGVAPSLWAVLTTRSIDTDQRSYYESRRQLQRLLRSEVDGYQAAWLLELTSGYAVTSGGLRRPHWNAILKAPVAALEVVRQAVDHVWCGREDALPAGQYVGEISDAGGLMRYIALHFQKESQSPPKGWRGHRFTHTRGYLWTDTPTAREEVKRELRADRARHKAITQGLTGHDVELAAYEAQLLADQTTWRLWHAPRVSQLERVDTAQSSP
jgi:hypothetical protein